MQYFLQGIIVNLKSYLWMADNTDQAATFQARSNIKEHPVELSTRIKSYKNHLCGCNFHSAFCTPFHLIFHNLCSAMDSKILFHVAALLILLPLFTFAVLPNGECSATGSTCELENDNVIGIINNVESEEECQLECKDISTGCRVFSYYGPAGDDGGGLVCGFYHFGDLIVINPG